MAHAVTDSDISVLITTVKSLHILEVLGIVYVSLRWQAYRLDLMSELVKAAGNRRLKQFTLNSQYYNNLPQHIQELYTHLLKQSCGFSSTSHDQTIIT